VGIYGLKMSNFIASPVKKMTFISVHFFLHNIVTPSAFLSALQDTFQGFISKAGLCSEDEAVEKLIIYKHKILAYLICCSA
jgi:hypothetical protein